METDDAARGALRSLMAVMGLYRVMAPFNLAPPPFGPLAVITRRKRPRRRKVSWSDAAKAHFRSRFFHLSCAVRPSVARRAGTTATNIGQGSLCAFLHQSPI
jgi:hypothetical protein